jgi:hypothetical protein
LLAPFSKATHEHQHIEGSELMKGPGRDNACVAVPWGGDGMDYEPIPSGIGKAAILIKRALLAPQYFRIRKVSFHGTTLVQDGRKDESAPGVGLEFCPYIGWSSVGHFSLCGFSSFVRRGQAAGLEPARRLSSIALKVLGADHQSLHQVLGTMLLRPRVFHKPLLGLAARTSQV